MSTASPDTAVAAEEPMAAPARTLILRRIVQGDLASVRVILAIAVIWVIFQVQNDRFLSAENLTNLMLQVTAVSLISVGVVMVLLLGEIDLSVGAVSGVTAATMAVLNAQHGWNPYLAIASGIAMGAAIGLLQGTLFTRFRIPSFVVTLAGLLAWLGLQLQVLGKTGTVNLTDPKITGLANTFYSDTVGWIVAAVVIGVYAGASLWGHRQRLRAAVTGQSLLLVLARIAILAAAAIVAVAIFNSDRGLPLAVLILLGFVVAFQLLTTRTRFGRHVYAVGGGAEAARRAGIRIDAVRVACFTLCSAMAAVGGIMGASRLLAVNQSSGGSDLLLFAIAGPVIAGTSLFGGRGAVWSALLGGLVIQSIANGMDLLALQTSVKYMVTGGVLLAAVIVDAVARMQRQQAGRV